MYAMPTLFAKNFSEPEKSRRHSAPPTLFCGGLELQVQTATSTRIDRERGDLYIDRKLVSSAYPNEAAQPHPYCI